MKFLLELVACGASCATGARQPAEEARYLVPDTRFVVIQEPSRRRAWRKHGRRGEWRPSLAAISEDVLMPERINSKVVARPVAEWRRELKRKVSSISQRDRNRSFDHDDNWGRDSAGMMPAAFAPVASFMF